MTDKKGPIVCGWGSLKRSIARCCGLPWRLQAMDEPDWEVAPSKWRWLLWLFGSLLASGAALLACSLFLRHEPKNELVYLRNIPYCDFVGYVVERNGTISLEKNYPL